MGNIALYWTSLVIPLMVFIPNLLWVLLPATNKPSSKEINDPMYLTILENMGRVGVTIIPLFYLIILDNALKYFYLITMIVFLAVYYFCWVRFFLGGRNYTLLFMPLWRIPIPMAISPIIYFILSAILLKSIPMLIAALLLAIGHIPISYRDYQRIKREG